MVKYLALLLLMLCITYSQTQAQQTFPGEPDVVIFYNDDKLVGHVKNVQMGELEIDADAISDDITIKLRNIKQLRVRRKLYAIEDVYNNRFYGVLDFSDEPGMVTVHTADSSFNMLIKDIDNLRDLDHRFWRRLTGTVSLGYSYTKSSDIGRVNGSHDIRYNTRLWTYALSGEIIYTIDQEFKGIEKADAALGGYIEFLRKWFSVTQVQYQRITELGVSARVQAATGVGPILIKNRRNDFRGAVGVNYQLESSTSDTVTTRQKNGLEIPVYLQYYYLQLGTPSLRISASNSLYFSTAIAGRIRDDLTLSATWKLVKHLSITAQFYSNYDSKPIDVNAATLDYGVVLGVGYTW
ncbi:uncharacterized protein DUF481 [Chitinophaga skermanii]|uniref:Uncharacterized protein DUF481 n=1 Tax=Chitinophaga skermanii TaxID=331697 RepID=A0A327QQH7_9BACT|nr:DUF481 domain-containing protein [Chitinophaga skermanii]RAJ06590.1 uncharacterized protein DUF481 [Chitinophaga skermanii]